MLGYLSADITCSEKRAVFRERSSRKTVSFEEQIMSKDKYLSIFSPQMETIVFIILQIFYATHTVLKIGGYSRISSSFSCWIFGHVTWLDQSHTGEKIWWIIRDIMISRDGTVGRRFTSDQCAICEFVVGSHFVRRVFLRVLRFPSHLKNQQFQIPIWIGFPS